MQEPRTVVIAVHGTFAPNAEWARQGSNLHRALLAILGAVVHWIPFQWGRGSNSHEARLAASADLEKVIRDTSKTFQGCRIFIIGHSHGGNVALMTLARMSPECPVRGVVCLSTPYISAKGRNSRKAFEKHLENIGALLGGILPAVFMVGFSSAIYALFGDVLAVLAFFASFPLYIWLLSAFSFFSSRSAAEDDDRRVKLIMAYDYRNIAPPVLSLRTTLDEAYLFVRVMSIVGATPVLLYNSGAKVLSFLCGALIVIGFIADQAGLLVSGFALVVGGTCFWLASLVWRGLLRLPSWGERISDGFEVKFSLSTEPPPGLFAVCRVLDARSSSSQSLLRHSRLYNSLDAAQVIAWFIDKGHEVVRPAKPARQRSGSNGPG